MSQARVRKLFYNALLEYTDTTGIAVYLDNIREFDQNGAVIEPPPSGNYLHAHLIPTDTYDDSLGGDHKVFEGIFQVTIVTEYGRGSKNAEDIADEIQEVFKLNKRFTDSLGFTVQVLTPLKVPEGRQQGIQWRLPVYFNYRADTN